MKPYKEVSNYIKNELGIGKKEIQEIIQQVIESVVKNEIHNFFNAKTEQYDLTKFETMVRHKLNEIVGTSNWGHNNNVREELIQRLGKEILEKLDIKVELKNND